MEVKQGYKQTEVGVIPEDWEVRKLGDFLSIKSGFAFSSSFFGNSGPILLTPGNFRLEGGLYFNERNTKRYSGPYSASMQFACGDLLIVMTDLTPDCNLLGKPAVVRIHDSILHNQRIGKIVLGSNSISVGFLYWFFLSDAHAVRMKETATGSTVRHTSNGSIYNSLIALPPTKAEQESIAEALSDADALVESLEQLIAKKRHLKQGAMQELLTGRRRVQGFGSKDSRYKQTEFGLIPEEWDVSKVGTEFSIELGKMLDSEKNEGVLKPYLGNRAVQWGNIDLSDLSFIKMSQADLRRYRLEKGDLLVCEGGEIGRAAIWNAPISECYYQKAIHRLRPTRGYNVSFMQCILERWARGGFLASFVTQTSIAHLPKEKLEQLPLPVPSTEEQSAIATILTDMDAEIAALEAKLDKARQIKQGMMQELLTGRIRLV